MDKKLVTFVCKMCGRALKAEVKPNFCYFDRMSSIENISDEDAIKMGLFSMGEGRDVTFDNFPTIIEFPADIRYCPNTGKDISDFYKDTSFLSLSDFQKKIMRRVINANK
jgi:hypothetical protein